MSASAPDVIGTGAAEPRRDDKDSPGILNRDGAALQDRAVVPQPVEVAQVQLPNVGEPLDRHDESLEAESPGQDRRIDPEGDRHLRPEDAAPSELHPAAVGGLAFGLHARLRVGKVTGPELPAGEAGSPGWAGSTCRGGRAPDSPAAATGRRSSRTRTGRSPHRSP